ncbi:protein ELYS-like [Etheostoma cragini]|uniref:protein ELYS-like n=1 Tax=Etheostoma cragini TaxID=417921 RepID=UPI00155F0876|nr:protein ELYS-like [Etheostoma cragini]
MLDTQAQWSKALADNNIRAIIRWLQKLSAKGKADVEEILLTFSCWVQRTSEFAKNELLTLCLSSCQGLWMFLDHSAFTRVHMLLQRLRNLLTLAQWPMVPISERIQLEQLDICNCDCLGVPCVVCRDTFCSSDVRRGCWNREHRALKQHIFLGRLVQWWGIMGLLPKKPEAHEVKRISQMWKEMDHSHWNACLKIPRWEKGEMERFRSVIQGMVTQLNRQHGCIWTSEDCTDHCYPPPNLQALLMLVLVPRIDNMSIQALFMYFVLDLANTLQCKDDLLKSFCHAFTIPSSFSQQIRAFWMLDHGHIKASVELLLSPRAAAPCLSWQHRCIIHCLLMRKQPQLALRYLHWTRPSIENAEDAKLCADVLLLNSYVSEAWALLKKCHTESDNMVMYLLQACNRLGLCAKTLTCIPAECNGDGSTVNGTTVSQLPLMNKERPPCPLSAKLYQAQRINTVSPEELVQLVREAVMEVRKPHPKISEVVWLEHTERKSKSREMFLSTQALRHLTPSPSPMDMVEETKQTAHTDELEEEQPQPESPKHISSSEDLSSESVSCFTSASSLPLLRRDRPYVYKSTLTLQRISSFLSDGENQSREEEEEEEEEESRTPSSVAGDAFPDCLERTMTLDGGTDHFFLGNLNNDVLVELVLSSEEGEEGVQTDVLSNEDLFSDAATRISMDETLPVNNNSCRLFLPPQFYSNEVSQPVPSLCEPQVECHSFISPDYGVRENILL